MLQRAEDAADDAMGSDVYQQMRYDLCCECHKAFLKSPLGRDLAKQFQFSKN
jgi:hypothetical protein